MSDDRITIDDIRKAGHCVSGARTWFQRHQLDFREFLKRGESADLLASKDGYGNRVVEITRARKFGEEK